MASSGFMKMFAELSVDLFCSAGPDGFFKELIGPWECVTGFSESELRAKPFMEFVHPEDIQHTISEFQRLLSLQEAGHDYNFVNRYIKKDGSVVWLNWRAKSDPNSDLIYAIASNLTSEMLEQSIHAKVESLAKIGHWYMDVRTNKLTWSQATFDIHEVEGTVEPPLEEAINFYLPEYKPLIERAVQEGIEQGKQWSINGV